MNRRVTVLVLAALLAVFAMPARAAGPAGPRLAISVFSFGHGEEGGREEVITTSPSGENRRRLVGGRGALIGDALSWSADGNRLAFSTSAVESTAEGDFGSGWSVVAVVEADGSDPRAFPRAFLNAGEPVMAPDGRSVVFSRAKLVKELPDRESYLFKAAIWSLDVESGAVRRLTKWRLAAFIDPISFSPDGSSIVATLRDRRGERIVAIDLATRRTRLLALLPDEIQGPTYSPDGTALAFVRPEVKRFQAPKPDQPFSEIWVAAGDGSGAKRLLRKKGYIQSLSWDPSGSRLAFTYDSPEEATGALEPEPGNKVMEINADGTCLTQTFTDPHLILSGSAWQPGVGREAGPIVCS